MYMDVFQTWVNLLKDKYNIDALILSIDYSKWLLIRNNYLLNDILIDYINI